MSCARRVLSPRAVQLLLWIATQTWLAAIAASPCAHAQSAPNNNPAAQRALDEAYRFKAAGDLEHAREAFLAARIAGASPQLVSLELGYLSIARQDLLAAQTDFERASLGPDRRSAAQARAQLRAMSGGGGQVQGTRDNSAAPLRARTWMEYAYKRKADGELDEAEAAIASAVRAGANRQLADLELGFISAMRKRPELARARFTSAARGPNADLADAAHKQLQALQQPGVAAAAGEAAPGRVPLATLIASSSAGPARRYLRRANRLQVQSKLNGAAAALEVATAAGGDGQRIALQLGYLERDRGDRRRERIAFVRAGSGPDPRTAAAARAQLQTLLPTQAALSALDSAYRMQAERSFDEAAAALERARASQANPQLIDLEQGYLARQRRAFAAARTAFERAASAKDLALAQEATVELQALRRVDPAYQHLDEAYRLKAQRQPQAAIAAFTAARAAGATPQVVDLEIGYLAQQSGSRALARTSFGQALLGPDLALATEAATQLRGAAPQGLPPGPRLWADLYAEAFGWKRLAGANRDANLVPTLRARVLVGPLLHADLHGYALAEVTRDLASRGAGRSGVPLIYSDNKLLFAAGALLRLWGGHVGLFGQVGSAIELVRSHQRVQFDARLGAYAGIESAGCWPAASAGAALRLSLCGDGYAELTYLSRFDHDVVAFGRARGWLGWALTGPLQWSLGMEARAGKDSNGDYYNNFADAGLGPGLRLLAPFHAELMLGIHTGNYFGQSNIDPAPGPLHYTDLRLQVASYVEF